MLSSPCSYELQSITDGHGFLSGNYSGLNETTKGALMSTLTGPFVAIMFTVAHMNAFVSVSVILLSLLEC